MDGWKCEQKSKRGKKKTPMKPKTKHRKMCVWEQVYKTFVVPVFIVQFKVSKHQHWSRFTKAWRESDAKCAHWGKKSRPECFRLDLINRAHALDYFRHNIHVWRCKTDSKMHPELLYLVNYSWRHSTVRVRLVRKRGLSFPESQIRSGRMRELMDQSCS